MPLPVRGDDLPASSDDRDWDLPLTEDGIPYIFAREEVEVSFSSTSRAVKRPPTLESTFYDLLLSFNYRRLVRPFLSGGIDGEA